MAQKYEIICTFAKKVVLLHEILRFMTILSLDTTTDVCSAALLRDEEVLASLQDTEGRNHAARLPQMAQELLQLASTRFGITQPEAVALSIGPGSYTGLRIGASFAKGLCYGLQVPLIPVPTLDLLTFGALKVLQEQDNAYFLPMGDARRMEVYTNVYGLTEPCALVVDSEEKVMRLLPTDDKPVYYFGNGAAKCRPILTAPRFRFIDGIYPDAALVGPYINRYKMVDNKELAYLEPFYLKDFQAAPSHVKGLQ